MRLGSCVAVALVLAGGYSSNSTPGLGTSICRGSGPRNNQKKKKKKKKPLVSKRISLKNGNVYSSPEQKRKLRLMFGHVCKWWCSRKAAFSCLLGELSFKLPTLSSQSGSHNSEIPREFAAHWVI